MQPFACLDGPSGPKYLSSLLSMFSQRFLQGLRLKASVACFGRQLVTGNLIGALHAMLPKVYLQATPRLGAP